METNNAQKKNGEIDLSIFWDNFRVLPWKFAEVAFSKPGYYLISVAFVYAIISIVTYFPNNGWMVPLYDSWLWDEIGSPRIFLLKHYPSLHIILFAWMVIFSLIIRWRNKIPDFFQWLWESNNLKTHDDDLLDTYKIYLKDYQNALLSRWGSLIFGSVLFSLCGGLIWREGMFPFVEQFYSPAGVIALKLVIIICLAWIFLIGQILWVVFITARYISKLPKYFEIRIQSSHPDHCGGLKPIGDFCFDAALFLIGTGLVLATIAILDLDIDDTLGFISTVMLFMVIGPLTALSVFVPIWNIHEDMVQDKMSYLDRFGAQIKELEKIILDHTKEVGNLEKAIEAKEKLEILTVIHPGKAKYPVWPFKFTSTVLAMFSPQILITAVEIFVAFYEWLPF